MSQPDGGWSIRKSLRGRLLLVALLWCALSETGAAEQYRFDSWTTDNGLPQVSINSIHQTRDLGASCTCSVVNPTGDNLLCSINLGGTSDCDPVKGCDCVVFAGGSAGLCGGPI